MNSETRNCQNCKKDFVIEPDDFAFYGKLNVPTPTFCAPCRMQRRMSFFNLASLYKRDCDLCGENVVSFISSDKSFKVYCNICWWSDKWDWRSTGIDYDPTKSFIEQLIKLRDQTPFMALEGLYPSFVNTTYTNYASYQKDCYMTLFSDYAENDIYTRFTAYTKEVMDSFRVTESELLYDCIGMHKSYKSFFCEEVRDSV